MQTFTNVHVEIKLFNSHVATLDSKCRSQDYESSFYLYAIGAYYFHFLNSNLLDTEARRNKLAHLSS
jgi:hypothetical protein